MCCAPCHTTKTTAYPGASDLWHRLGKGKPLSAIQSRPLLSEYFMPPIPHHQLPHRRGGEVTWAQPLPLLQGPQGCPASCRTSQAKVLCWPASPELHWLRSYQESWEISQSEFPWQPSYTLQTGSVLGCKVHLTLKITYRIIRLGENNQNCHVQDWFPSSSSSCQPASTSWICAW